MTDHNEGEPTTTTETHPIDFHAWISDDDGNDLKRVDLRTLSDDRLEALSTEAGTAGDLDTVIAIDVIVSRRHR